MRHRDSEDQQKETQADPVFLGDLLVYELIHHRFGLPEDQVSTLVAELQEPLRGLTGNWVMFYLSWVYKRVASELHGPEFAERMLAQAVERLSRGESVAPEVSGVAKHLSFWAAELDKTFAERPRWEAEFRKHASRAPRLQGLDLPFEALAAMSFLALDMGSPYYHSTNTNLAELDVAVVLESARDAASPYIRNIVQIGRPLEDGA